MPGLIDNHLHIIRGGLNFNMELRWDGVRSLADAMAMLKAQVAAHAAAAVGPGRGRLHRASVRGEAAADAGGDQRSGAGHAGLPAASLRPGAPERCRAARCRLHQGHARASGRRDRPRRAWRADRAAARPAQRGHSLRDAGEGPQAAVRVPAQLDPAFHARAEPAGRDRCHRRRRRLPELSGGLQGRAAARCRRPAHRAARLQPVHAEAQGGEGRLPALDRKARATRTATTISATMAAARCWCSRPPTSRTSGSSVRTCRPRWRASSRRSSASSPRTGGRGGCMPPTTRRSVVRSTCSRR